MAALKRVFADPITYRRLGYLLSGWPLGLTWFVSLVTLWSLCIGLAITPFVIPLVIALGFVTRGFAAVEAAIARSLLDVEARAPAVPTTSRGFWSWFRGLFGGGFWRAQGYLFLRWVPGLPVAVVVFAVLAAALGATFAPLWVPFVHGGARLGFWRPHTFVQSLALVPIGLVVLTLGLLLVRPLAAAFRALASSLLRPDAEPVTSRPVPTARIPVTIRSTDMRPRRALELHAGFDAVLVLALIVIWALTSGGYFWPVWVVLPLGAALAIHVWLVLLRERPSLVEPFRASRTLAAATGAGIVMSAFFVAVWAITGTGYLWPIWPMLGMAIVTGIIAVVVGSPADRVQMAERIETLESTRAAAVDLQDSELRRIERDLHDGAQARLVALGMSLGMAEQKLADDPEQVAGLLAEARAGAESALEELRDLARGIHPPVLGDRGLEAALRSLASASPMRVEVRVELAERPPGVVESAAYFVAAEALANATKHAYADRVDIRITNSGGVLELEVEDDGRGGADPNGTGLLGMRRRVEALDGTLSVVSPTGGPTTIHAELPCAS